MANDVPAGEPGTGVEKRRRSPARRRPNFEELRNVLSQAPQTDQEELEQLAEKLGAELSEVAQFAAQVLQRAGAYQVLCPACGGGHCSAFLASRGFQVTAFDVSERAIGLVNRRAERVGATVECYVDDIIVPRRRLRKYDAIFSHNVLHQVRASQRDCLLRSFYRSLKQGGVLVVSVLSTDDDRYGYGRQVEPDTFEFAVGETLHFYSAAELHEELGRFFEVARVEEMEEVHHTFGGKERYRLLVATALKTDAY